MEAIDAILTRRSIRKFTEQAVSDGLIRKLLQAAMSAPSAGNQQPWQFIVLNDRNTIEQFSACHPAYTVCKKAAAIIIVCGDASLEKYKGFWVMDCSAATENILIAAKDLGLGAVWTGAHMMADRLDSMRELFNLPGDIQPLSVIPVGYAAEEMSPADRFDVSRIHYNGWL